MLEKVDWFDFIVGGIIVGFIVNVFSSIAHPRIEQWWGKFSLAKRIKNEENKKEFEITVERLLNDKHEELVYRVEANRHAIFAVVMFLIGIIFLLPLIIFNLSNDLGPTLGLGICSLYAFGRGFNALIARSEKVEMMDVVDEKLGRKKSK